LLIAAGACVLALMLFTACAAEEGDSGGGDAESSKPLIYVKGKFDTDGCLASDGCLACGEEADKIQVSDTWCSVDGDKALVGVTMKNTSIYHLTVNWHPSYTIVGGSEHGAGLTSLESSGFDAGETRQLVSEQNPDGIEDGFEIGECKPSFYLVEVG
jgi:hypothetical protein